MANKHLKIDTFGEIMDEFIHKSEIMLVAVKKENSDGWKIETNHGCGTTVDMFVALNVLGTVYVNMLDEGDKMDVDWDEDKLAETMGELMVQSMKSAAKKRREASDG